MTLLKKVGLFDKVGLLNKVGLFQRAGLFNSLPFPSILKDGNTVKWFDYLLNITKSGGNLTSVWDNKTGIPGIIPGALLQADGAKQPLWSADGILFDGIDNFIKTAAFTYVQPERIYIVFKQVTLINQRYFIDGENNFSGIIYNANGTDINILAGSPIGSYPNTSTDFMVVRALFSGASSALQINDGAILTGDAGGGDMGGLALGSRADGISNWSNIQVKEIILRKIADTTENEQDIYDYLAAKYSI